MRLQSYGMWRRVVCSKFTDVSVTASSSERLVSI
jgi:hypothetical protein